MPRLILLRVVDAIPAMLIVSFLIFFMTYLIPGSAAAAILGDQATPAAIAELEERLGLNRPVLEQYWSWISGAVQGDFGTSIATGRPVMDLVEPRIFATVCLTLGAVIVGLGIGLPAGIAAARRPGRAGDRIQAVLTALAIAIPSFWLGLILLQVFAVELEIFPVVSWRPPERGIGPWAVGMVLPCLALGLGGSAIIARQTRSAMIEALESPYIKTLRAVGTKDRTIVFRYALKNAMIPILTVTAFQLVAVTAAGFIVERVFSFPGLGTLLLQSVQQRDIPVVQAVTVIVGVTVIVVYLAVDVAMVLLNPKVRTR